MGLFLQPPPELVEILIKFTYEVLRVQPKDIIAFGDVFFEQELRRRKAYGKDFGFVMGMVKSLPLKYSRCFPSPPLPL